MQATSAAFAARRRRGLADRLDSLAGLFAVGLADWLGRSVGAAARPRWASSKCW